MKYHVYRTDHAGRGVQHNEEPFDTWQEALTLMDAEREANPVSSHLNPRPVFYLVSEADNGQRLPYPVKPEVVATHRQSAARGQALTAVAAKQNDVGGDDETLTSMSAVVDLMHAAAARGENPAAMLELAQYHYGNDEKGEW